LAQVHERLRTHSYKAEPVLRVYIAKPGVDPLPRTVDDLVY
jgi:hypothetical protein